MTFSALLIHARHRQSAAGLHNLVAMRIVALHAIHSAFDHWMMLWQVEKRVHIEMALKTGSRVFAWIDDETSLATAHRYMFAGRSMTRFATGDVSEPKVVLVQFAVGAGRESTGDVGVAFDAGSIADIMRALDLGRGYYRASHAAARNKKRDCKPKLSQQQEKFSKSGTTR